MAPASKELEHVRGVWSRAKDNSPIYQLLLPTVSFVSACPGRIVAHLPLNAAHVNSRGSVHGAVSAALIDWAGGMAIATYGHEKTGASVDIHVCYTGTAGVGDVVEIVATADKVGRSLAFTSVKISKVVVVLGAGAVEGEGPGEKGSVVVATGSHTKFLPVSVENRNGASGGSEGLNQS